MLCDSTNANIPGVSASEGDIPATFNRLVANARQRVIIASFASNVYRVQLLLMQQLMLTQGCIQWPFDDAQHGNRRKDGLLEGPTRHHRFH